MFCPKTLTRAFITLALFLPTVLTDAWTQVPVDFHPQFAVLRSSKAEGTLADERVRMALWYASDDLKVPGDRIPRILVVHGGSEVATVAGIPLWNWNGGHGSSGAVVMEPVANGEKLYYLWVIGKPSDEVLARGMVQILESEMGLDATARTVSIKRVLNRLTAVVQATDLQNSMLARAPK